MRTDKSSSLTLAIIKRGMLPILPAFCAIGFLTGIVSYRNSLTERQERLTYQVQVMVGTLNTEWVQGNYSKVARFLQQRTSADLVAFYSPDCSLIEATPENVAFRIQTCADAGKSFPDGVFNSVADPTGRIGKVFIESRLYRFHIFLPIALQVSAYLLTLTFVYFVVFSNFLRNELSAKVKELMTSPESAASSRYEEFEPIDRMLRDYQSSLAAQQEKEFRLEYEAGLGRLAAQVAHDIRSPLAALEMASADASYLPEEKRILIRSAVGRIRDIANSLLHKQRPDNLSAKAGGAAATATSPQLLSSLIETLVTEKRLQFRSRSNVTIEAWLDASSYGIFAEVHPVEFKRMLSNLIDNAVEAFSDGPGAVRVNLRAQKSQALVSVSDNGKGIPADILSKLGQRGESYGKAGGSGLGLYHARTTAESWGGNLQIDSQPNHGTAVTIRIPQTPAPAWFVSELGLPHGKSIAILDDDSSIHQIWQGRFESLPLSENKVDIVHLSTPSQIREWAGKNPDRSREALYLLDYELLGYEETGLSLAEELGVAGSTILVTSRYEEPGILNACRKLGARMIPKSLAGLVPIRILTPSQERVRLDAVLIDDDPLARMTWKMAAGRAGKSFQAYASISEFLRDEPRISLETPIYVDADLGNGIDGAQESQRIHALGFHELSLATGHDPAKYREFGHLQRVVGKEPPWTPPAEASDHTHTT